MISTLPNSGPDPEKVRLAQQVRRWKNTCLNMMDRYTDLCEAAGVSGLAFFEQDMDDVHETLIEYLKEVTKGKTGLKLPVSTKVAPMDILKRK